MIELVGLAAIAAVLLAAGLALAFSKGWIGLSPERVAKLRQRVDDLQTKLDAKLTKKTHAPLTSKSERLDENAALLAAGKISQAELDVAKAKILAE